MTLEACRDLVERGDPDRYAAVRGMPEPVQAKLLPILAFNIEVSRAPWVTQEDMIAEMRLQWWRDALEEIAQGKPVRSHEVTTPLAAALAPQLAQELDHLVAARRWDIYSDPFEDADHQDSYLRQTGGTLMWAMAASLGATNADPIRHFGMAVGAAGFLKAVPELQARGKAPLLEDGLPGIYQIARKGMAWFHYAQSARRDIEPQATPALLTGWWAKPILRAYHFGHPERAEQMMHPSEFRKRARLAKLGLFGWWR